VGESLHTIIETFVPRREIETHQTIDGLLQRVRQCKHEHDIAVLLAGSKQELEELVRIGDLFEDLRIILVVPDGEEDAIANTYALRPRFLTYSDSEYIGAAAVLSKMLVSPL
jgi:hypothetical protein